MRPEAERNAIRIFLALCLACTCGLGWFYWRIAAKRPMPSATPPAAVVPPASPDRTGGSTPPAETARPHKPGESSPRPPRIFFRWTATDPHYGQLAFIDDPGRPVTRFIESLSCEVVHYAAGKGICLEADRGVFTRYAAEIFDSQFRRLFLIPLNGIPSRTRLSHDGRLAAVTVFLTGHSYASVDFTTQTLLLDTSTGQIIADLEKFAISRDGRPFQSPDFNFWGVTFTPGGNRFYCTLSTNRNHYLVRAEVASRRGEVIRENVECPSLSPDATRVAYKKRLPGDRVVWQLHVLDLATQRETPLKEKRSVDDQLEWFDQDHVLYALPESQTISSAGTDVWIAPADGRQPPRLFLAKAYSPAVVR